MIAVSFEIRSPSRPASRRSDRLVDTVTGRRRRSTGRRIQRELAGSACPLRRAVTAAFTGARRGRGHLGRRPGEDAGPEQLRERRRKFHDVPDADGNGRDPCGLERGSRPPRASTGALTRLPECRKLSAASATDLNGMKVRDKNAPRVSRRRRPSRGALPARREKCRGGGVDIDADVGDTGPGVWAVRRSGSSTARAKTLASPLALGGHAEAASRSSLIPATAHAAARMEDRGASLKERARTIHARPEDLRGRWRTPVIDLATGRGVRSERPYGPRRAVIGGRHRCRSRALSDAAGGRGRSHAAALSRIAVIFAKGSGLPNR